MSNDEPNGNAEGPSGNGAHAAEPAPELAQQVDQLTIELSQAKDRELRAMAEMDNLRRRLRREMEDERRYAEQNLLRDLLPVLDNITRATQAAGSSNDHASLLAGVQMVRQQLEDILKQHQCVPIPATGEFDPNLHQAISMQPSADHPSNTILQCVQQGFQLHERVVRPAQVIVSTGAGG